MQQKNNFTTQLPLTAQLISTIYIGIPKSVSEIRWDTVLLMQAWNKLCSVPVPAVPFQCDQSRTLLSFPMASLKYCAQRQRQAHSTSRVIFPTHQKTKTASKAAEQIITSNTMTAIKMHSQT